MKNCEHKSMESDKQENDSECVHEWITTFETEVSWYENDTWCEIYEYEINTCRVCGKETSDCVEFYIN